MNKIGSEFLDDFELNDAEVFLGINKRMIFLWLGILSGMAVTITVVLLGLPDIIFWVYDISFVTPLVFYGVSADKMLNLSDRFYFLSLETTRVYQTEFDNKEE